MERILRYNVFFYYYRVSLQSFIYSVITSVLFPVLLNRVLMSLRVKK